MANEKKNALATSGISKEKKDQLVDAAIDFIDSNTGGSSLKSKLSSRKFWLALAGVVVGILGIIGFNDNTAAIVAFALVEVGSILGYCLAEGMMDANHLKQLVQVVSKIIDMIGDERTIEAPAEPEPEEVPEEDAPEAAAESK